MARTGRKVAAAALGLLLAAGVPSFGTMAAHADPGCGGRCECPCGEKCPEHDAMHGKEGGDGHGKHMHGKHKGGGPPMKEAMGKHLGEVRRKIAKLREVEAKMAGKVKDAEAFRASSLEHAKLLTDLQESHLKHMEGMMGGGQTDRNMK